MAELFIELFSEEIPAKLQIDARKNINEILCEKLQKKEIKFKSSKFFSVVGGGDTVSLLNSLKIIDNFTLGHELFLSRVVFVTCCFRHALFLSRVDV